MWLLNTTTIQLEPRNDQGTRYAILSHRWEDGELSFGDIGDVEVASQRKGFQKVKQFCAFARRRGYAYAWVDTCCIDKKSSAELSEALNSMYRYYEEAGICFVYLYDVVHRADLARSSWFSRGWTLQELLAPTKLLFVNRDWEPLLSRRQSALMVEKRTGIPRSALTHFNSSSHCIAEKFSWSARRVTDREEDRAYCLLGLLDINMPVLYGEGKRAFQRLQEEIMKVNTDMSLFLWQGPACPAFGMLAEDPSCFRQFPAHASHAYHDDLFRLSEGWSINNAGISMTASIEPYLLTAELDGIFALYLHQPHRFASSPGYVILVQEVDQGGDIITFARVAIDGETWKSHLRTHRGAQMPFPTRVEKLRLTRHPLMLAHELEASIGLRVKFHSCPSIECVAFERPVRNPGAMLRNWSASRRLPTRNMEWEISIRPRAAAGIHCCLVIKLVDDVELLVCLGIDDAFRPFCIVLPLSHEIYNDDLDERGILREYCRSAKRHHKEHETVVTESKMVCVRGREKDTFIETPLGLDAEFSTTSGSCVNYTATIDFRFQEFILRYLPDADVSFGESLACVSRGVFERLRSVENSLEEVRRYHLLVSRASLMN